MKFFLSPRHCLAIFFLCSSFNLLSQTKTAEDYLKAGSIHSNTFNYDSAIHYFLLAKKQSLIEGDTSQYYVTNIRISFDQSRLGQFKEALETIQESLTDGKNYLSAINISRVYRIMGHIKNLSGQPITEVIPTYEKALSSLDTANGDEVKRIKAVIRSDLGILNFNHFRYDLAEREWRKSLSIIYKDKFEKPSNAQVSCEVLMNLAAVLRNRGANSESIKLYEQAGDIAAEYLTNADGILAFVYDGISGVLLNSDPFSKQRTIDYYLKAINLMRKQGEGHNPVHSLLNLGEIYSNEGRHDEAFKLIFEALRLSQKYLGENSEKTAWSQLRLGSYYLKIEELTLAERHLSKAIEIQELRKQNKSPISSGAYFGLAMVQIKLENKQEASLYISKSLKAVEPYSVTDPFLTNDFYNIAGMYKKNNELDSALSYYHKSLIANHDRFDSPDYSKNPTSTEYSSLSKAFQAFEGKAFVLEKKFEASGEVKYLKAAYQTILIARDLVSQIRGSSVDLKDKLSTLSSISQWSKTGLRISVKLYELFKEEAYINTAFELGEANKANLLLTSIRQNISNNKSNVPIEVIEKGNDIANSINFYEQQLYSAKETNDSTSIDRFQNILFDFTRQSDSLRTLIKSQYPSFYKAAYRSDFETISSIQKNIEKDEIILDYHYGDSSIYLFSLDKENIKLSQTALDTTLTKHVFEYIQLISNPSQKRGDFSRFLTLNKLIRDKLLPNDLTLAKYKKLTFVTDSYLSILPFETLILQDTTGLNSHADLNYLIMSHIIRYANSLTLLAQLNTHNQSGNEVLAFAPIFNKESVTKLVEADSTRNGLGALVWTKEEVEKISNHFETKQLIGKEATELKFREASSDYPIIHVASHGLLNSEDPLYSKLVFSPFQTDSVNDGFLNTQELFNMKIPAEMVVLSACNSGSGDIISGEGLLSLAHGFFYAGSKSLVMSLWTANDQSTATIIEDFYDQLAQGKDKSASLRNAKLKFLDEADELRSHPYYWAHMVVNGNDKPLVTKSFWWIYLIVGLGVITLFAARRRMKRVA